MDAGPRSRAGEDCRRSSMPGAAGTFAYTPACMGLRHSRRGHRSGSRPRYCSPSQRRDTARDPLARRVRWRRRRLAATAASAGATCLSRRGARRPVPHDAVRRLCSPVAGTRARTKLSRRAPWSACSGRWAARIPQARRVPRASSRSSAVAARLSMRATARSKDSRSGSARSTRSHDTEQHRCSPQAGAIARRGSYAASTPRTPNTPRAGSSTTSSASKPRSPRVRTCSATLAASQLASSAARASAWRREGAPVAFAVERAGKRRRAGHLQLDEPVLGRAGDQLGEEGAPGPRAFAVALGRPATAPRVGAEPLADHVALEPRELRAEGDVIGGNGVRRGPFGFGERQAPHSRRSPRGNPLQDTHG